MYILKFLIDENCCYCLFKRQVNYKSMADPEISKRDGVLTAQERGGGPNIHVAKNSRILGLRS